MFWKEYMDEVATDLHAFASIPALTKSGIFRALTIAQHEIQKATGAARRSADFDLSTMTTDGVLSVGDDIRVIDRAEFIQLGDVDPSYEFTVVDMDAYLYAKRNGWRLPMGVSLALNTDYRGPHMVTLDYGGTNVYVYPNAGLLGTLRLHYQPVLRPYAPSETTAWPGYAADFNTKVTTLGPERIFDTNAQRALICRAKMLLATRVPGLREEIGYEFKLWEAEWLQGIQAVEDANPSYGMTSNEGGYFVPVG